MLERVGEDPGLDLIGDPVRMWPARAPALLDQGGHTADLEGPADLVKGVAMVAHDATGLGDVLKLLSQLQQRQLPSSTLSQGGHSFPPEGWVV